LLPKIEIPVPEGGSGIEPGLLFPATSCSEALNRLWLEIGFGAGEHLAWQAAAHPDTGFIGCEPFINGVARLLSEIDRTGLGNIRLFQDDARLLLAALPDSSIDRAFILFPDPWRKTRHHKRRIIGPTTLPLLARVLADGAELRVATDDPGYKSWILHHVRASDEFEWMARSPGDWRSRPADWPATRYEAKAGEAGRTPSFFLFTRRVRSR
jgi:tRNA (guanine-N7-)-methyltransferase